MAIFACYFPDEENPYFFTIDIDMKKRGYNLYDPILSKLNLRGVHGKLSQFDVRLLKANVPCKPSESLKLRALEWLHSVDLKGQEIDLTLKLNDETSFPTGPHEDSNVDIIIATPEVLERLETLGNPLEQYNWKIKKDLDARMDKAKSIASPSEVVLDVSETMKVLGCDQPTIYTNRPGGISATLFNPVLAKLQQDLQDSSLTVTPSDVRNAQAYINAVGRFYSNEKSFQVAIECPVNSVFGTDAVWDTMVQDRTFKPGAIWWGNDKIYALMLWELKNLVGLGGDAILQAAIDYIKLISSEQCRGLRSYCNFPVILIGAIANRLEIAVAVSVGQVYVTRLLVLDISSGFSASDNVLRLARVFKALKTCFGELKRFYAGQYGSRDKPKQFPPKLQCLFPNPTPATSGTKLPNLVYHQFLSRNGRPTSTLEDLAKRNTAMYIATLKHEEDGNEVNKRVLVKFTGRYNADAHRLLNGHGLAPALYCCERVVGDLFMVVMEYVQGISVWQLRENSNSTPIPAIVVEEVEKAVRVLHNADIVFGDLQDSNILYVPAGDSSKEHVVLVDFDWPAKAPEGRYPPTLNANNTWADGVEAYALMYKEHDLWQVDRLKGLTRQR